MGKNSKIEWTHHTFNPWWGCVKVSPGCEHCYAETFAKRTGHDVWGPAKTTPRRFFGDKHWAEPLKWNAEAEKAGERRRVFCASMCDVFEDEGDNKLIGWARAWLWLLIERTPMLDWLLLTKRPENMTRMTPRAWESGWPRNVWAMTTAEDQQRADERIPALLRVPAAVRGLSCEPLLGAVDLRLCDETDENVDGVYEDRRHSLHWVIVGGESGPGARPMHPDWARSLRDQCTSAGVAFHFKQWGEWLPNVYGDKSIPEGTDFNKLHHLFDDGITVARVGKHTAGRLLDGREWNEFPQEVTPT